MCVNVSMETDGRSSGWVVHWLVSHYGAASWWPFSLVNQYTLVIGAQIYLLLWQRSFEFLIGSFWHSRADQSIFWHKDTFHLKYTYNEDVQFIVSTEVCDLLWFWYEISISKDKNKLSKIWNFTFIRDILILFIHISTWFAIVKFTSIFFIFNAVFSLLSLLVLRQEYSRRRSVLCQFRVIYKTCWMITDNSILN